MAEPFPDYRSECGDTREFAVHRIVDGKIVEVWGAWIMAGSSVLTQLPGV